MHSSCSRLAQAHAGAKAHVHSNGALDMVGRLRQQSFMWFLTLGAGRLARGALGLGAEGDEDGLGGASRLAFGTIKGQVDDP